MKCISIVNTPLQLLNCIEFVSQYNVSEHTLLVYVTSEKRLMQIKSVLQLSYVASKIDKLHYIIAYGKGVSYLRTLSVRIKEKAMFLMKDYDYCIICNYHAIAHRNMFRLASSNPKTQLVHLDDGLAIADCVEQRKEELALGRPVLSCSRSDRFLYNYHIYKYVPKSILYFTPYKVKVADVDRFVKNEYSYLKSHIIQNNNTNFSHAKVIFLGQPIVASGMLTKEQYSFCLEKMLNLFGINEGRILYLPHPVEDILSSLDKRFNEQIEVFKTDLPFELLCMSIDKDALVIGFYTAALSCIKTFDIKCRVYAIHPKYYYKDDKERHVIEAAYEYLRNMGINEINI